MTTFDNEKGVNPYDSGFVPNIKSDEDLPKKDEELFLIDDEKAVEGNPREKQEPVVSENEELIDPERKGYHPKESADTFEK